jgi:hypothetical protein
MFHVKHQGGFMRGDHLMAFGIGIVVGWLVIPMILQALGGTK